MHTRITLSAAIYQKILTLNQVTIGRLTIGHVVNLASNDVHRLDMVGHSSHNDMYMIGYRKVTRAKSKSSAVVKHQRVFMVLRNTSIAKRLFKSDAAPLFSDFPGISPSA